jgi:hypothetical protein
MWPILTSPVKSDSLGTILPKVANKHTKSLPKSTHSPPPLHVGRFTDAQLIRYKEWFHQIDMNRSGSVDVGELSAMLIGAGVVKNRRQARIIFKDMDTNGNGSISFNEFLAVVADSETKRRMQVKRLDAFVASESLLDPDTLLSLERRHIIMQQVIHQTKLRATDIDWIQTMCTYDEFVTSREDRMQMHETHRQQREASNKVLAHMKAELDKVKAQNEETEERARSKVKSIPRCLVADIEDLLPPSLRASPTGSEDELSVESMDYPRYIDTGDLDGDDHSIGGDSTCSDGRVGSVSRVTTLLHTMLPCSHSPAASSHLLSTKHSPDASSGTCSPAPSPSSLGMHRSATESDIDKDRHRLVLSHMACRREESPSLVPPQPRLSAVSLHFSPVNSRRGSRVTELSHHHTGGAATGSVTLSPIQFRKKRLGTFVLSGKDHSI